jgi:acyl-CoA hydrolase
MKHDVELLNSIAATRTEMTQIVMPTHTNGPKGAMFGGVIMQWVDICGGIAAMKHCGSDCVTASIDRMDFIEPIRVSDIVVLRAQVNATFHTSMEVGCRVEAYNRHTRRTRYTTKAYLTFVAMDEEGQPRAVQPLIAQTPEDEEHIAAAVRRRQERLKLAGRSA